MPVIASTYPAEPSRRALPRLRRVISTSAFRLTVVYAGLFVLSVSVLFGTVSWSIGRATRLQLQRDADDEMDEVKAAAGTLDLPTLTRVVNKYAVASGRMHYLLQDKTGVVLAGNMPAMAPIPGAWLLQRAQKPKLIRGRGKTLADGYLFVGVDDLETIRLRRAVSQAFVASLALTVVLALGGGALTSLSMLRRVETIGRASRDIMAGDLAQRLPLSGNADEFDQLGAALNAMLDRIQVLMAGLQQVSSDIAHDLRTPLTRMRQQLELASRRETTEAGLREALGRSIGDVDAILATFSALLRIAQVQAGTRRAGFATLDLAVLVTELTEIYRPVVEAHDQILLAPPSAPILVRGDRELLTQMVVNLVENAIRHTPAGTTITVGGTVTHGRPTIVLADNGPGVPERYRTTVLTRFYRLEGSRTTPGNGLGLALVAAVAALHEADLLLEDNTPGLRVLVRFRPA